MLGPNLRVPTHQKTYNERERQIEFIYMGLYGSAHTDSKRASKKERLKIVWRWKACSRWFLWRELKMEALSIVLLHCVSECCQLPLRRCRYMPYYFNLLVCGSSLFTSCNLSCHLCFSILVYGHPKVKQMRWDANLVWKVQQDLWINPLTKH